MRTICLYFQVHQPFRLKRYRFFDIGDEHYYYDDYTNNAIMRKVAHKCYLPTNKVLLDLINEYGSKFKVSFSISGTALEQLEMYAPDVLDSFKELAATGSVEFLSETYAHSLASLKNKDEFIEQIKAHTAKIQELFGQTPTVFRNTELIYSDAIGEVISDLGYKAMLTEGAKHILGWKSPNYLYYCATNPKLKLLLKNFILSDDIAFRFSNKSWEEWPLTAEKYVSWINRYDKKEDTVNLFMDYETFGEHQWAESGIFEFLKSFPKTVFANSDFVFATPSEVAEIHQPVAAMPVLYPISWADAERDTTAWLGNELQNEACTKIYELAPIVRKLNDESLLKNWYYLQNSDHFYYMSTKFFADASVHKYFSPYNTPYDAFINYMNVLSDFIGRIKELESKFIDTTELSNDDILKQIEELQAKIDAYKIKLSSSNTTQKAIAKTKAEVKVIENVKKETKAISKTKKEPKIIEKKKEEPKAIEKIKKQPTPIEKTKEEPKALLEPKKEEKKITESKELDSKKKTSTKKKSNEAEKELTEKNAKASKISEKKTTAKNVTDEKLKIKDKDEKIQTEKKAPTKKTSTKKTEDKTETKKAPVKKKK